MSKAIIVSISIFLFACSIAVLGYITNQASLWSLPSNMWKAEQNIKQENKPVKVNLSDISTGGTLYNLTTVTYRISNPSDKHVAICLYSMFTGRNSVGSFITPPWCWNDIPPFTTVSDMIANYDGTSKIKEICFDQNQFELDKKSNDDLYQDQLKQWQATMDDYAKKAADRPIYNQAIKVLLTKKPQQPSIPRKVFSWEFCDFEIKEVK